MLNYPFMLSHRRSNTVSLETYPFIHISNIAWLKWILFTRFRNTEFDESAQKRVERKEKMLSSFEHR